MVEHSALDEQAIMAVLEAPPVLGLAFRRFRGEPDYPVMVAILDACNVADRLEFINTVEEVAWVFGHLTNYDPYHDMLFAEVEDETVAFSRVWWVQESIGERLYKSLGFVRQYVEMGRPITKRWSQVKACPQDSGTDTTALPFPPPTWSTGCPAPLG